MNPRFGVALAGGALLAIAAGPACASSVQTQIPSLSENTELIEDFTTSTEVSFMVPAGDTWYLYLAFGAAPKNDAFNVDVSLNGGGYNEAQTFAAPSSGSWGASFGEQGASTTWDVTVTLQCQTSCSQDPFGGFEISNNNLLPLLPDPDFSATPLPAALPLLAGGLGLMGIFGWRRKRSAQTLAA